MNPTTIQLRIDNTKANIEKTKKTLERYEKQRQKKAAALTARGADLSDVSEAIKAAAQKARNGNSSDRDFLWDLHSYEDTLEAIGNNQKKLAELKDKLKGYLEQKKQMDKENEVPMVPAVEKFLSDWRTEAEGYYRKQVTAYNQMLTDRNAKVKDIREKYHPDFLHRKEIETAEKEAGVDRKSFQEKVKLLFSQDVQILHREGMPGSERFEAALCKMMDEEIRTKRIDLYHRCAAAVGVITDATDLSVGNNGSLNGCVVGEQGKAHVETIWAGGYNIQCLHYRVLVKPIREKSPLSAQICAADDKKRHLEGNAPPDDKTRETASQSRSADTR